MQLSNKQLNYSTIVSRAPDIIFNIIDDEVIILSLDNEEYYSLNQIGSAIWETIKVPKTIIYIIKMLLEEYEVTNDLCENQTFDYLHELYKLGVISLKNE